MSGIIDATAAQSYSSIAIVLIGAIASGTDVWRGRIYNWLTFPAMLSGLVFSFWQSGFRGLGLSLVAVALGFLLYGWMFFFKAMGAGDVKLLMAFGAWGGIRFTGEVALLGVLVGGAMALVFLAFQGQIVEFFHKMHRFLLSVFIKELEFDLPKINRKLTMPFGVPISIAAVWTWFVHPLQRWGVPLW